MKKANILRNVAILFACLAVTMMTACSGGSSNKSAAQTGDSEKTTKQSSSKKSNVSTAWPDLDWVEDWMKKDDIGKIVKIKNNVDKTIIYVTFENVSADGYEAYVAYMAKKGNHRMDSKDSDMIECTGINVKQISMSYEPFGEKQRMDVSFYK